MTALLTKTQTKLLVTILGSIGGILALLALAGSFIIYISRSEIGTALEKPLGRLTAVEESTKPIPQLKQDLQNTEMRVIRLQTTVEVYFENQPVTKKTAENVTGRAVDKVLSTKNLVERKAALEVAGDVLERAASHHVVLDYKKMSHFGLALLDQPVEETEKSEFKRFFSELAKQRTLSFPPPEVRQSPDSYVVDKEQRLDGESFENVTFVNCTIRYDNGFVDLDNVRFINCTFDVSLGAGNELYRALFKSEEPIATVSVKSKGKPGPPKEVVR